MDITQIVELVVGPVGAVVVLCIAVYYFFKENRKLRTELDEERNERLKELKESEMMSKAYLRLREGQDLSGQNRGE